MRRRYAVRNAALLVVFGVLAAGCSADHGRRRDIGAGDLVGRSRPVAANSSSTTGSSTTGVVVPSASTSGAAAGSAGAATSADGGRPSAGRSGAVSPGGTRRGSAAGRAPRGAGLPADADACLLLTADVAAAVLTPRTARRSTDVDSVCAFSVSGGTVLDLGDAPLGRGQTASGVLAQEVNAQGRSGYRAARLTVAGRFPGVLEDGRPHVAQVVWVQRGRVFTLTLSPAGSTSTDRLVRAASSIGARFGP